MELCRECNGAGFLTIHKVEGITVGLHNEVCSHCAGTGGEPTQVIGQTANYDFNMTPEYIERDR